MTVASWKSLVMSKVTHYVNITAKGYYYITQEHLSVITVHLQVIAFYFYFNKAQFANFFGIVVVFQVGTFSCMCHMYLIRDTVWRDFP